jgi:hypothetical protein
VSTGEVPMGTKSAVGIARICAVAFGVLYVVAMLMIGMANDTSDKTPDQIMKDFDDNKSVALVGGYLLVIVGLLFLPLAWTAIQRVRPGLSAMTEQLAKWTALLFTAMVAVGGMVLASIAGAVIAGSEDNPPADIIRFIPQIGYGISLVAGALAVAVFLALVSRAGLPGSVGSATSLPLRCCSVRSSCRWSCCRSGPSPRHSC